MKWSEHVYKNKKEIWQVRHITDIYTCVDRSVDQSSPWHNFKQYFFLHCSDNLCNTNICTSILSREANLIQTSILVSFTSIHGTSKKNSESYRERGRQGKRQAVKEAGGRRQWISLFFLHLRTARVCVFVCVCVCVCVCDLLIVGPTPAKHAF